jgi:hypothetical protein
MERRKNSNATHGRKCAFKTVGLFLVGKSARILKVAGLSIPGVIKIFLGIFILWAALGVGELFGKIDLMMMDF